MTNLREKLKENWKKCKIGDICMVVSGSTPSTTVKDYWGDGHPLITPLDLSKGHKYLGKIEFKGRDITAEGFASCSTIEIPNDSVVMSSRAPIGYLTINKLEKAATNQGCKTFIIKNKKEVDVDFLYYLLKKNLERIKKFGSGSTFLEVSRKDLEKLEIFLPSVEQQEIISKILSKIDKDIEATDEIIKKTEKLKKGLMQKLLTEGIWHKKFKKTKLGMVPEGWEVKKIKDVCENLDNKRIPIEKNKRERGRIPYYGATGIVSYVKNFIFNERLLLVGEDGADWSSFANTAFIASGKSWVNNHVHVLRCKKISIEFLKNFLNYADLTNYTTGTTRGKLNKNSLMNIEIVCPPIKEQEEIARIFSKIEEKVNIYKESKNKLEIFKKGLMQDLLL